MANKCKFRVGNYPNRSNPLFWTTSNHTHITNSEIVPFVKELAQGGGPSSCVRNHKSKTISHSISDVSLTESMKHLKFWHPCHDYLKFTANVLISNGNKLWPYSYQYGWTLVYTVLVSRFVKKIILWISDVIPSPLQIYPSYTWSIDPINPHNEVWVLSWRYR